MHSMFDLSSFVSAFQVMAFKTLVGFLPSFWFAMFEEAEHSLHAEYYSKMGQKV